MTSHVTARSYTVVVADDDPLVCDALSELIGDDPRFDVRGVGRSGLEAADIVSGQPVDLAIVDVQMPQGGIDAIVAILSRSPSTTVVVFTAKSGSRMRHQLLDAGASAVLYKGRESDITGSLAFIMQGDAK